MEPSSAKENAPKMEKNCPMIHGRIPRRRCGLAGHFGGLQKMPVPIMVPTTMAAEAQAPRPAHQFETLFSQCNLAFIYTRLQSIVTLLPQDSLASQPTKT